MGKIKEMFDAINFAEKNSEELNINPPAMISIFIATKLINNIDFDLEYAISYSAEGGLCFTFFNNEKIMYLEIYNDGDIGYIIEDKKYKKVIENEGKKYKKVIENKDIKENDIIYLIKEFLE